MRRPASRRLLPAAALAVFALALAAVPRHAWAQG
jgi:hypothetical protein